MLGAVKFDYKLLLLWHLNQISRISTRYVEKELSGQKIDPDKEYNRGIVTLKAFLTPYLDTEFEKQEKKICEKGYKEMDYLDWSELLGALICLLDRKQWLVIEDVIAEDDEDMYEAVDPDA